MNASAIRRFIGPVDAALAAVVLIAVVMPPRELHAYSVWKGDDASFALALAEARSIAAPSDGAARAELSRRLEDARQNDWAIEDAARGAAIASPATAWQAWLAVSIDYVDRLDAQDAFDDAVKALAACDASACPSWERARMEIYRDHLDAGIKSRIDPKRDPVGFRLAGERAIRAAHIGGLDRQTVPTKPRGTGSAGSATAP